MDPSLFTDKVMVIYYSTYLNTEANNHKSKIHNSVAQHGPMVIKI